MLRVLPKEKKRYNKHVILISLDCALHWLQSDSNT